ncbi:MAG: MMPL family transporter, partial [Candidatus Dormibacterales bacterium]
MSDRPRSASWPTRAFTWLVVRLRFLVVAGWVAAAVVAYLHLPALGQAVGGPLNLLAPSGSPALAVERRSLARFGNALLSDSEIVQRAPGGLTAEAQKRVLQRAHAVDSSQGRAVPGLVAAVPVTNTLGIVPSSRERSTTAVTYLYFSPSLDLRQRYELAHRFARQYVNRPQDHLVGVTGAGPARWEQGLVMDASLPRVELATVLLIATIVAIAFRGLLAPLVTLAAAGLAYELAQRVVAAIAQAQGLAIPVELQPLLVVLLLAIVTDYSIFFLAGARRRLRAGMSGPAAARETALDFMPIIVVAGLTVAASTAALLAADIGFLRALGPGLAISVLVGLAAAVTLVPALLAIFGRALFWPSLGHGPEEELTREERAQRAARSWRGRLTGVLAYPVVALLVAAVLVAGLGAAGRFATGMRLGVDLVSGLPQDAGAARAAAA